MKLGILSNVDEDLLAGTRRHFLVPFDLVVTAERVHSYKPGTPISSKPGLAWARLGGSTRHRAISTTWCRAKSSAFRSPGSIWGKAEPPGARHTADWEFRDLARFADWMVGGGRA